MPTSLILLTALMEIANTYALDAVRALPAAIARIMLGWKTEPGVNRSASLLQKAGALIGSVALAIAAGDMARSFDSTKEIAGLIVVAVAFNAQHAAARLIILSNPFLRGIEKRAKRKLDEEL